MKICYFGTYDNTYTSNKMILQGLTENKIPVVEINAHIKVSKLTTKEEMSWFQILKRILRKYRIFTQILKNFSAFIKTDVIYVGYPGHVDVFLAYILAKLFGKKLVFNPLLIVYIGFTFEQGILKKGSFLGKTIKFAESLVYKMCDLVFADTPYQKEFLMKDFGIAEKKLKVLPIGADNKGYAYSLYKNESKKINVVYYGLYSPVHGVEYIIEAANILRNDKDVHFSFIGQGNTFEQNLKRANDLKLPNVTFYHDVPESEHLPIMQTADIFLGFLQKHPTVDRVIPNKVYQGLALGRAVLTADAPVTRSVFAHKENMYLVKPADPKTLARAILELKDNPVLRGKIALNGYKLYKEKFNPKAVGKQLASYIKEIVKS